MDEWATQLLLNSGTLCPSSYLVQGQDFILYCSTTKVNNSMLCIFARTQQITFPKPTEKGCKYILAWKVECQTHDYFSPCWTRYSKQTPEPKLYWPSLLFITYFLSLKSNKFQQWMYNISSSFLFKSSREISVLFHVADTPSPDLFLFPRRI